MYLRRNLGYLRVIIVVALLVTMDDAAHAAEHLQWKVSYKGIPVGKLWGTTQHHDDGFYEVDLRLESSAWYKLFYPVKDVFFARFHPQQGSQRHRAKVREGRFVEDQDWVFAEQQLTLVRKTPERQSTKLHTVPAGTFDPISGLLSLRWVRGAGPWTIPVFNGKKMVFLYASKVQEHSIGYEGKHTPCIVLSLRTDHRGDMRQTGRSLLYLSADKRRLPVLIRLQSNIGLLTARLVSSSN